MSVQLIAASVWSALTDAARRSKKPAYAAVASFGKGAADLLRLPPGSQLVVDASECAVKHGQTHPADLKRMRRRKVLVYVRIVTGRSAEEWAGRLMTLAEMPVVKGVPSKIPCQTVLAPTALPSARTGHRNSQPAIARERHGGTTCHFRG
jgi:hypothetical protein